jgi:RNA polymerase sigma-70 factor (ECF subfamily)
MSRPSKPDTEQLLEAVSHGDVGAKGPLLQRHRDRLKRMVAVRFDRRLSPRVDPSDLVQEALAEAADKLDAYIQNRPISFYPWLRQIAEQRIIAARRRHLHAGRRTLARQDPNGLPAESVLELAERLLAGEAPSAGLRRKEQKAVVRAALDRLKDRDREVLVLRFLEELPSKEVAEVLGITEGAVRVRMMRALQRLRDNLKTTGDWS